MLILTRKVTETIMIGDDIKIVVLSINGSQAKIGIEAPPNVSVHRQEIYERIQREQRHLLEEAQEVA